VEEDAIRLRLFPFSLLWKAKQWFYANRADIYTWEKCSVAFLVNFFWWAEPMLSGEEFRAFSKQQMKPF
jgi:hypothetical protein